MGKKKYVKKSQKQLQESSKPLNQSSITLEDFYADSSPVAQEQFDFNFDVKKILHLWLVGILPPSKYLGLKLNFEKNKIIGLPIECEKKIEQCRLHLQFHSLKAVFDMKQQMDKNFELYLTNRFGVRIFGKSIILSACKQLFNDFRNKNISTVKQTIEGCEFAYLISVQISLAEQFAKYFDQSKGKQIKRSDIENAKMLGLSRVRSSTSITIKNMSASFIKEKTIEPPIKTEEEQKQSSVIQSQEGSQCSQQNNNFYTFAIKTSAKPNQAKLQQKTNKQVKEQLNKTTSIKTLPKFVQQQTKKTKYVKKKYVPANEEYNLVRTPQKVPNVLTKQYDSEILDVGQLKKWIKFNNTLKFDEFSFQTQQGKVTVQLNTNNDAKRKIQALNIYLQFSRVIILDSRCHDHRVKIEEQFCGQKQNHLECKIIEGFSEPNVLQHRLRNLISEGKIKRTDRCNKKFVAVWIEGLKPYVQKMAQNIRQFIDQLPKQDKIQAIILNMDELQEFLHEDRVKQFAQTIIMEFLKKNYPNLTLEQIICPSSKLTLKLRIKHQDHQEFKAEKQKRLSDQLKNCFYIGEILDEKDVTQELEQKFFLYRSLDNKKKFVIIEEQRKGIDTTRQILNIVRDNNSIMNSEEISFKKGRYPMLNKYLSDIKADKIFQQILKNVKFTFENQNKVQIFGTTKNIKQICEVITQFLNKLEESVLQKTLVLTEQQAIVVQKNLTKFSKQIQNNYKLSFNLSKDIDLGAIITVGPDRSFNTNAPLVMFIQKHKNLSNFPQQTLICFQSYQELHFSNEKMLIPVKAYFKNQNKQIINVYEDVNKNYIYLYSQGFSSPDQMSHCALQKFNYQNIQNIKHFAFFMPKKGKKQFVLQILKVFQKQIKKYKIRIYILEDSSENIKHSLGISTQEFSQNAKKIRYYVFDKKKFFYSPTGDEKIYKALNMGKKKAYLTNEDLNLQITTHQCSFKQRKLIHTQSGKQTSLQIYPDKVIFELNGIVFSMPDKQVDKVRIQSQKSQWVDVSIGAYELDFVKNIQINLFSGFSRDLQKQETIIPKKIQNNLFVSYDEKVNEIEISYEPKQETNAIKACQKLKEMIQAQRVKVAHDIGHKITNSQFLNIKTIGQEDRIDIEWDGNAVITLVGYEKANITNLIKNLKFILADPKQVKYPDCWEQQKQDIKTFVVSKNSQQFSDIQKSFTYTTIRELIRIQNKIVYKKYFDEKNSLATLNGGKQVLEMKLYHGTRQVDPKLIYEDKQESFNINYTSDSNYLGRGTYFAVKSQYSHNYSYPNNSAKGILGGLWGGSGRQMFYCSVLVGDSQNITVVDHKSQGMKDTDYKNAAQKIRYESSTTFTNNSTIYCVYKNRRAYPHYLIRY